MSRGPVVTGSQLRSVRHDLVSARDAQIAQVVAMVDRMPARGDADALIAPLRLRLADLRPRRPVNFTRLLFAPIDKLILPSAKWRRDSLAVPRGSLAALSDQIRAAMPELAVRIDRQLESCSADNTALLDVYGQELWEPAACCLATGRPAADWAAQTGLNAADHAALSAALQPLLSHASTISRMVVRAGRGVLPEVAELEAIMAATARSGPMAMGMLMALLMARLPRAHELIAIACKQPSCADAMVRMAADRAIDFMLEHIEQNTGFGSNLAVAMDDLRLIAGLLTDLQEQAGLTPARRARGEQLRRQVEEACRSRFQASLTTLVLDRAASLPPPGDPSWVDLETSMRDLRRFSDVARCVGSPEFYDKALLMTAETLRPETGATQDQTAGQAQARIQRVRLIEILCGPDRAAALLGRH